MDWYYTNPFKEQVTIQLQLAVELDIAEVQFVITDIRGQVVKSFRKEAWKLENGRYEFTWDGADFSGKTLPAGIYFFNVRIKKGQKSVKLIKQTQIN